MARWKRCVIRLAILVWSSLELTVEGVGTTATLFTIPKRFDHLVKRKYSYVQG